MKHSIPQLKKDGRGYYRVRWYDDKGERQTKGFGKVRSKAINEFSAWLSEWAKDPAIKNPTGSEALTIQLMWDAYWPHAVAHYVHPDGTQTGEAVNIEYAFSSVLEMYGDDPAVDFAPPCLSDVQSQMIASGKLVTTTINARIAKIKGVFKWAVGKGMIPESVWSGLLAVGAVKAGRGIVVEGKTHMAKRPAKVCPVPEPHFEAVAAALPATLRAMVWFAWWTGARPGEVCRITGSQITMLPDGLWLYRPERHKTAHKDKARTIIIGPHAQKWISPYLRPDLSAPLFSPTQAHTERHEAHKAAYIPADKAGDYRTWPSYLQRQAEREAVQLAPAFDTASFRQAVEYGCVAAGVPAWSPNRLRHNAATRIRAAANLDAVQVVLGHSDIRVTQMYAETPDEKVMALVRAIG